MNEKIVKFSEVEAGEMFHARGGNLYQKLTDGNFYFCALNLRTNSRTNFDGNDLVEVCSSEEEPK